MVTCLAQFCTATHGWAARFMQWLCIYHWFQGRRLCAEYYQRRSAAAAILIRDEMTGDFAADVLRCPPIVPNLPYSEINITIPINGGKEPMIMRMHSGPKGDLWIRKDGPNHRWNSFERVLMFYPKRVHAGLMLLAKDYLSLQDRLEHCQSVLDVEVKENQRKEAVIWRHETALGRLKAKIAKLKNWAQRIVIYSAME